MKQQQTAAKRKIYWYQLLPWICLVITLSLTYWAWDRELSQERNENSNAFNQQFNQASQELVSQLKQFEQSLYAVRGLFDASTFVSSMSLVVLAQKCCIQSFRLVYIRLVLLNTSI
jgi:hypothetical protein